MRSWIGDGELLDVHLVEIWVTIKSQRSEFVSQRSEVASHRPDADASHMLEVFASGNQRSEVVKGASQLSNVVGASQSSVSCACQSSLPGASQLFSAGASQRIPAGATCRKIKRLPLYLNEQPPDGFYEGKYEGNHGDMAIKMPNGFTAVVRLHLSSVPGGGLWVPISFSDMPRGFVVIAMASIQEAKEAIGMFDGYQIIRNLDFSSFPKLERFIINMCLLEGSIPELGMLSNLAHLSLHGNYLNGTLPVSLTNLTKLVELDLSGNNFTSTIPSQIGNKKNLLHLDLNHNEFSGRIPSSLGSMVNLTYLDLSVGICPSIN
ncbi:MDIS1-interacting receptor like kinase 2-like protein [Tanacetum coccineum]